jgi:hypothetical protein
MSTVQPPSGGGRARFYWCVLWTALPLLLWLTWLWLGKFLPRFETLYHRMEMTLPYVVDPIYAIAPRVVQHHTALTWTGLAVVAILAAPAAYIAVYGSPPARYKGRAGVMALCLLTLALNVMVLAAIVLPLAKVIEGLGR